MGLGDALPCGPGGARDYAKARGWLQKAADQPVEVLAFHNANRGYAWFYEKTLPLKLTRTRFTEVQAQISGVEEGEYEIEYWHTLKGAVLFKETVPARKHTSREGCYLPLKPPPFEGDVAVKFRKKG